MDDSLLSVCIIAKNEEKMLAQCLESVAQVAGEIILVDTGSTDGTCAIASRYGCRILHHPWNNDFSDARNVALAAARLPWILSIDADERLLDPASIHDTLSAAGPNVGGILIEVISYSMSAGGTRESNSTSMVRLFRNNPAIRFEGIIHEQVLESILAQRLEIAQSSLAFLHEGYNLSPQAMREKHLRNISLLNTAIKQKPTHAYAYLHRAKTYLALGNIPSAEADIHHAVEYAGKESSILPQALCYQSVIACEQQNYSLAIETARQALTLIPYQSLAWYVVGESCHALGLHEEAISAFTAILSINSAADPMAKIAGEFHHPPEHIYYRIGRSAAALGRWQEAEKEYLHGLAANPNDISCLVGCATCAMNVQDYDRAKKLLQRAESIAPQREDIRTLLLQLPPQHSQLHEKTTLPKQSDFFQKVNFSAQSTAPSTPRNVPAPPPARPLLSLSMIVKNEEQNLADCLKSVEGVADEIVILDTGSTDSTIQIARSLGAKVYQQPWTGDFAEARNASLKECTGKWILYLDADERLHPDAKLHLRSMLASMPEEIGGIVCTITSPHRQNSGIRDVHRGSYPRIFRNYGYPNISFQGRVHEQITPSILSLGGQVIMSEVEIYHLGYDQSREIMEQKVKRNYDLLIQHVREEPENSYAWFQLGQTLARMELTAQAEQALKLAIDFGTLSPMIAASAAATLSQIAGNEKRFPEALTWADYSLTKAPKQSYALSLKAFALLYLGRAHDAENAFLEVKKRIADQRGVPQTGFEVEIAPETIEHGLREAQKLLRTQT
jgi:glycosyltransferase involved in cell wall biosynthesis